MGKIFKFEIETVTPTFLAGADQNKAELRAPSIKGLLRFWWRVTEAERDIEKLKIKENKIFGSTMESGKFAIRVLLPTKMKASREKFPNKKIHQIIVKSESQGREFPINILEYLAYGTFEYKKGKGNIFIKEYIPPGYRFNIIINIFDHTYTEEILKTMFIFSLFGGLGSRSRNGFGGFEILNHYCPLKIESVVSQVLSPWRYCSVYKKASQ